MFGLAHVCSHQLDDDLRQQWLAHLCGLCLSLRDAHGQLTRAVTNTDAVTLSILVEAQQERSQGRIPAGRCALRGMRTAAVLPADAVPVRLGRTASLTLAAAKAADVVAEERSGLAAPTVFRSAVATRAAAGLHRKALADEPMAEAVDTARLLSELAGQAEVESQVRPGDGLARVTSAAARAAEEVFAASAAVAGRPENDRALRRIGSAYGALAHLIDAVEDLAGDTKSGRFNPIAATGHGPAAVRAECDDLVRQIREGFDDLVLTDGRLARLLLVDGSATAVRRAFRAAGVEPDHKHGIGCAAAGSSSSLPPGMLPAGGWPAEQPGRRPFWRNVLPWIGVYCTGYACCADHTNPCTGRRHKAGCSGCDCCDCDCCCDCH